MTFAKPLRLGRKPKLKSDPKGDLNCLADPLHGLGNWGMTNGTVNLSE
jgi:hypothetical protein